MSKTPEQLYDINAEKALIASVLIRPKVLSEIIDVVSYDNFYEINNAKIFKALTEMYLSAENIDIVTLSEKIRPDGISSTLLNEIISSEATSTNAESYAKIVSDKYKRRVLSKLVSEMNIEVLKTKSVDKLLSDSIDRFSNIVGNKQDITFDVAIKDMFDRAEEYKTKEGKFFGFSMGIEAIDYILDGIQPGQLIGLAAYTSQGKTWDILNIAAKVIKDGGSFCFFSLEMSPRQIVTRLIAILSGIDINIIKKGLCSDEQLVKVNKTAELIKNSGSTIYTNPNLSSILLTIRKEALVNKPTIFLLDYLQLVQSTGTPIEVLSKAAKAFQTTMSRVNIPMFMLSQISEAMARDSATDFNPFKGSGDINNSVSTAIYKKSSHTKEEAGERLKKGIPLESTWYIQKNRDGDEIGSVRVFFDNRIKRNFGEKEFDSYYTLRRYEQEVAGLDYTKQKNDEKDFISDPLWDDK